jgi:hypothetical protein
VSEEGVPVSITTNPQERESSADTLAALSQALEEIARETKQNARPTEAIFESEDAAGKMQEPQMLDAIARRLPQRGALPLWSLIGGLLSLACIATIVFAWPSPDSRAAKPTIPSSVNAAKTDTGLQQPSLQAQTMSERAGSAAASSSPEQTQLLQRMTQVIEELKSNQAQLARDNARLAGHLKETQEEMARHDAALASGLKAAQEEMTRDNLSMAAQLKVSQEQIAAIGEQLKATQEQLNRLAPPKPRPPRLASPSPQPPNVIQTPKPAPKPQSSQAGGLPKNSTQSPPKQP